MLNFASKRIVRISDEIYDGKGVGPGITFGKELLEYMKDRKDMTIGLIPTAVGGTAIEHWLPDGNLFNNMLEQTSIGMRLAENDGLKPRLAGLLFYQGESDATSEALAADYESKLEVLMKNQLGHVHRCIG